MMNQGAPDQTMLEMIGGAMLSIITGAFAHMHIRINRVEDKSAREDEGISQRGEKNLEAVWKAIDDHRKERALFEREVLSTMVRKDDLRTLESLFRERPR